MLLLLLVPDLEPELDNYPRFFETLGVPIWLWTIFGQGNSMTQQLDDPNRERAPIYGCTPCFRGAHEFALPLIDLAMAVCASESGIRFLLSNLQNTLGNAYSACVGDIMFVCIALDLPIVLRRLLKDSPQQLNSVDHWGGLTLLNFACRHGSKSSAIIASMPGVDANIADQHGATPLINACDPSARATEIGLLLAAPGLDVDVNRQDDEGRTALMHAADLWGDDDQVIPELSPASHGTNLTTHGQHDSSDLYSATPTHSHSLSVAIHDIPNANIGPPSNLGTAKLLATYKQHIPYSPLMRLIIDARVAVNMQDNDGKTALMILCSQPGTRVAIAAFLERDDIDINLQDKEGHTALHTAYLWEKTHAVSLLSQDHRTNINIRDTRSRTPLMLACGKGLFVNDPLPCVRLLLEHSGIDISARDRDGNVALQIATRLTLTDVRYPRMSAARQVEHCIAYWKILLDSGADPSLTNLVGSSPLSWALVGGHQGLLAFLRKCGALPSAIGDEVVTSFVGVWEDALLLRKTLDNHSEMGRPWTWPIDGLLSHYLWTRSPDLMKIENNTQDIRSKHRRSNSWPAPATRRSNELKPATGMMRA